MKREKLYVYVRVEVVPVTPELASLTNKLIEVASGGAVPDVIPPVHPGGISFRHCFLVATDDNDAYDRGWPLLGDPAEGAVCNDYVIALDPTPKP